MNNMNKLISVIIPVYNHAKTLKTAMESVHSQSYRPMEVIIVNDGSTDNFREAADTVMKDEKYKEFGIVIINQENRGAPAARNRGFSASKGEYVIFFDADTIASSDMMSKMKTALENHPDASYAYSGYRFGWKAMKPVVFDMKMLKRNNFIDVTALIRRNDFPGFDEAIKKFQDWDLWLTMLEKNKTGVCVPEILYKKIVGGRIGISRWLPKFAYRLPWTMKEVRRFHEARLIVMKKHGLTPEEL